MKITQKLQGPEIWENIKQARGNECSQYKSTAAIFPPVCPLARFIFTLSWQGKF
jgi:hypothetical protein